jgi:ABC-type bacteriocin/lantibiotic exporter with double-glycine peptidase domain
LIFVGTIFVLKNIFDYENALIIETLALLALCLLRSFPSFSKILSGFQELNSRIPSVEVISQQLSEKDNLKFLNNSKLKIEKFNSINLSNISFRYDKNDEYILKDLNLSFSRGNIIGFFGKTGSGKSTLINIISGLIKPSIGKIFVNQKHIERVPHNYFSYVPQKPLIINDTIKSNIAFGVENENIDLSKLNHAIEKCELREFIQKLPNGINEIISEDGKNISGGQAQRISIARAIYFDRQILILDESTNSLDLATEKKIINFLNELKHEITIIMISHNLESLKICNEVYELKGKKLNKIK